MKNKLLLAAMLLVGFVALSVSALAQTTTAAASGINPSSIVTWLTPVLVPLIIAGVKKFSPSIPSYLLPIIAPVLGMLIDLVNSFSSAHQSNLLIAALLGLAGVGVREVKDQLAPQVAPITAK